MSMLVAGDWVRFYRDGKLVIGVVEYVKPDPHVTWKTIVYTDIGTVWEESILESRQEE